MKEKGENPLIKKPGSCVTSGSIKIKGMTLPIIPESNF